MDEEAALGAGAGAGAGASTFFSTFLGAGAGAFGFSASFGGGDAFLGFFTSFLALAFWSWHIFLALAPARFDLT